MLEEIMNNGKRIPRDFTNFKKSLNDIASASLNEFDRRWKKLVKMKEKLLKKLMKFY